MSAPDIIGLREMATAFRKVNAELPKELRVHFMDVAKHVVGIAQQRMPFSSGEAARSLKPRAGQTFAGIAFPEGGTPWRDVKADYYPWLDFGGTTGRGHVANGHNGFGGSVIRGLRKGGRYLYPAIGESTQYIAEQAEGAVMVVADHAGFKLDND